MRKETVAERLVRIENEIEQGCDNVIERHQEHPIYGLDPHSLCDILRIVYLGSVESEGDYGIRVKELKRFRIKDYEL